MTSSPDPGFVGPDSVTWQLHVDPAMLRTFRRAALGVPTRLRWGKPEPYALDAIKRLGDAVGAAPTGLLTGPTGRLP